MPNPCITSLTRRFKKFFFLWTCQNLFRRLPSNWRRQKASRTSNRRQKIICRKRPAERNATPAAPSLRATTSNENAVRCRRRSLLKSRRPRLELQATKKENESESFLDVEFCLFVDLKEICYKKSDETFLCNFEESYSCAFLWSLSIIQMSNNYKFSV